MTRRRFATVSIVLAVFMACGSAFAAPRAVFDGSTRTWRLSNLGASAEFQLTSADTFELRQIRSEVGDSWIAPFGSATSPVRLNIGGTTIDVNSRFVLVDHFATNLRRNGLRQTVVLDTADRLYRVTVDLEIYGDHPVLRHSVRVTNRTNSIQNVRLADLMPYQFTAGSSFQAFRVNQWSVAPRLGNFETAVTRLAPAGTAMSILTGAGSLHCTWTALSDGARGLFAGWEFDGRAQASIRQYADTAKLQFAILIADLNHPVAPGETFDVPAAFLGLFRGDWDEAGFRTQRFVEAALAKQTPITGPASATFPYVVWDSWGYSQDLDEAVLRQEAGKASMLGVELFVLDLGWAKRMGDWYGDPVKFPSGIKLLSDYVHSRRMRFGLHFALTEAAPDAEVLQEHPDWTSSTSYGYHGAVSLCLGHKPVRDWLVQQAVKLIDDYGVDWFLQDGENMVKVCTKASHTHAAGDSNYSGSVNGIDAVVEEVQRLRPRTMWENCENGGNMMTYKMVGNYVTSITNDASGALGSRQAVFGATYPLPPRYTDRYMIEQEPTPYVTRSYMFGGPWILMNRLAEMSSARVDFLASEIAIYKSLRGLIKDGKVFHLSARPLAGRVDAIESYNDAADTAVAIVTREGAAAAQTYTARLRGLNPARSYNVWFGTSSRKLLLTGAQILQQGVLVSFENAFDSELIIAEPAK